MKKNTSSPTPFLQKIYEMLENESISHIIAWHSDGTEFIISSINEFSEKVLPTYFAHCNFTSFIRQLNMYDFHKLRSINQEHIYTHPLFIKDRPDLLKEIRRKSTEPSWAVMQEQLVDKAELTPLINKLYQLHKINVNYEGQINSLEEKASFLIRQNKTLADKLWVNKEVIKKIEKALIFLARIYKRHEKGEEFSMSFPMLDNIFSITQAPSQEVRKKIKITEDSAKSENSISFSEFEEELQAAHSDYEVSSNLSEFF